LSVTWNIVSSYVCVARRIVCVFITYAFTVICQPCFGCAPGNGINHATLLSLFMPEDVPVYCRANDSRVTSCNPWMIRVGEKGLAPSQFERGSEYGKTERRMNNMKQQNMACERAKGACLRG
jgi:hypothetical protein